ncbi:MAG TPA: twin-arginine translocase TatA/TatE family subunit [Oleiagrimonas sp.]|nr:twin-arginine translocase TatA/TatE family subunit [Oleiagrimonas sp.]
MGLDSIWHWLILLVIVLALFGTSKLRKMGPDLGNALREFKKAVQGDDDKDAAKKDAESLKADPPAADSTQQQAQHDSSASK